MQARQLTFKGATAARGQGFATLLARVALRVGNLPLEPGRILTHQSSYVLFNIVRPIEPAANGPRFVQHGALGRAQLGGDLLNIQLFQPLSALLLPLGTGLFRPGVTRHDSPPTISARAIWPR